GSAQSRGGRIELVSEVVHPAVGSQEARAAALQAQSMTIHPLVLVVGDDEHIVPAKTLKTWIAFGQAADGSGYLPSVVAAKVRAGVKKLVPNIDRAPANAGFVARDGRVVKVIPSRDGRKLDVAASTARISEALAAITPTSPRPRVDLVVTATAPALTTEQAQAYAPKMRRLSSHTTVYTPSEKNFFGRNISIPTSIIDGYVVAPGEWFDFWVVVGEVSRARGFGPGGAIINGRTEPTGALAGGICSCSTTLFNAALKAGLELGARRNHYYYINRYPLGLDATVFKSSSGSTQTMSFRNDTPYPVLVRGINDFGKVTFQIYSVPNGRTVSVGAPRTANFRPARDSVVYTDTLPAGARKRIEYPVDGLDVWRTWTVRDANGTIIHQKTFYSHYARITGIVLVGRGSTDTNDTSGDAGGG
ncbi:MAG TPA: VanW family protein, partial [Candidatus Limnocylindrales bacterium]|nr:VanW family protein [Candidatus Limnocylindrales bacterium]